MAERNKRYHNIAAAWIRKTKAGEDFLSIKAEEDILIRKGEYFNLWKNRRRMKPNHPNFHLMEVLEPGQVSKYAEQTPDEDTQAPLPETDTPPLSKSEAQKILEEVDIDDIPF